MAITNTQRYATLHLLNGEVLQGNFKMVKTDFDAVVLENMESGSNAVVPLHSVAWMEKA